MTGILLAAFGLLGLVTAAYLALDYWAERHRDTHEGATLDYADQLRDLGQEPATGELATRQDERDERDDLARVFNDMEANLFAGLTDVLERVLVQLDVSYADLAEHRWDGVRELAGVGA